MYYSILNLKPVSDWVVVLVDRSAEFEHMLASFTKKYSDGAVIHLGDTQHLNVDVIPPGSLALDIAFGVGGIPRGRAAGIYGPESSGKTTLCQHVMAEVQKRDGLCGFIDMEHALDPGNAARCGVGVRNLYVSQPDTGKQVLRLPF